MLPKDEWDKITQALDRGTLKLRFLTDQEYADIEKQFEERQKNKIGKKELAHA